MPHKHRLPLSSKKASNYDLPPTSLARPLSTRNPKTSTSSSKAPPPKSKISHNKASLTTKPTLSTSSRITKSRWKPTEKSQGKRQEDDDTPRAFARLLSSYHPPPRSGLDDGAPPSKKPKTSKHDNATGAAPSLSTSSSTPKPALLPGESLSAYGARVDAALPIAGLGKAKGRGRIEEELKGLKGLERRQTKDERKMQKMQQEWRAEEARRRAKREELREEEEELESQDERAVVGKGKKGRRGKRDGEQEEDIWAAVGAKRGDNNEREMEMGNGRGKGLVGLHDVVLAPPKFAKAPMEKFKVRGQVGRGGVMGLKRQGELSEARKWVVEGYRALMRKKSGDGVR